MKADIRLATEQFCYIEFHVEADSAEDILSENDQILKLYRGGGGLEPKEWNRVLDNYLWGTETMIAEEYESMSKEQMYCIQEIKKSRKRK